jgi:hypothetical protein
MSRKDVSDTAIFGPCNLSSVEKEAASQSEVVHCCLKGCKPELGYCKSLCKTNLESIVGSTPTSEDNRKCLETCDIFNRLCIDECFGLSPGFGMDNKYYTCAKAEAGCVGKLHGFPDEKCVKNHQQEIFDCCVASCRPEETLDCNASCKLLEASILDPESLGIESNRYPQLQEPFEHVQTAQFSICNSVWIWVLCGILVVIVSLSIFAFVRK